MNVQFESSEKRSVKPSDVIINGKKRGTVFPYESEYCEDKFQCQLNFAGLFNPGGFGQTMEEAVENTIQAGHDQLAEMTADFNAFLAEVKFGEDANNEQ